MEASEEPLNLLLLEAWLSGVAWRLRRFWCKHDPPIKPDATSGNTWESGFSPMPREEDLNTDQICSHYGFDGFDGFPPHLGIRLVQAPEKNYVS